MLLLLTERPMNKAKYTKYIFWIAIIALAASAAIRVLNPLNNDFEAFFNASAYFLDGDSFYVSDVKRPFKYPPATMLLLAPLSLLEGSVARVLFLFTDILACFLNIALTWYLFFGNFSFLKKSRDRSLFYYANAIAIFSSLRFIDNEFHSKNINQITFSFILLGLGLLLHKRRIFLGLLSLSFGSIFKLTPFLAFWCFLKRPFGRNLLKIALALSPFLLFPSPRLWLLWVQQMKNTTGDFSIDSANFFQGFFSLSALLTQSTERSYLAVLMAAPFLLLAFKSAKRISIEDAFDCSLREKQGFAISFLSLVLLSITLNPLAWHHLYGFLLIFISGFTYWNHGKVPTFISIPCLLIAILSRGVAGQAVSTFFENHQGVLICTLVILTGTWLALFREQNQAASSS